VSPLYGLFGLAVVPSLAVRGAGRTYGRSIDNGARVLTAAGAYCLAKSWFGPSAVAAMSSVSFLVYACVVAVT
jgi:hypothetical protein